MTLGQGCIKWQKNEIFHFQKFICIFSFPGMFIEPVGERSRVLTIDIREYIDCSLAQPATLFWLSSYVAGRHLAVAPLSGVKQIFYCTVYYITLNSNCEAQRASKNWGKNCSRLELVVENNV
jgi:hypothetical protein